MPGHLHGMIVVCEVGTAPRGRPFPGIENGLAHGLRGRGDLIDLLQVS